MTDVPEEFTLTSRVAGIIVTTISSFFNDIPSYSPAKAGLKIKIKKNMSGIYN
jgi:hypothetical protein